MPRLDLPSGDTILGKDPDDLVGNLMRNNPLNQGMSNRQFMLETLKGLRAWRPDMDIPDSIANDADAFLRVYPAVGAGVYTPGPSSVPNTGKPKLRVALSGLGGFGGEVLPTAAATGGVIPALASWKGRGTTASHVTPDGRRYTITRVGSGCTATVDYDGPRIFLSADGSEHARPQHHTDPNAAWAAVVAHDRRVRSA